MLINFIPALIIMNNRTCLLITAIDKMRIGIFIYLLSLKYLNILIIFWIIYVIAITICPSIFNITITRISINLGVSVYWRLIIIRCIFRNLRWIILVHVPPKKSYWAVTPRSLHYFLICFAWKISIICNIFIEHKRMELKIMFIINILYSFNKINYICILICLNIYFYIFILWKYRFGIIYPTGTILGI